MKNETTIRFTPETDGELLEIAESMLDGIGYVDFAEDEKYAIRNALRFAFDAGAERFLEVARQLTQKHI